MNVSRTYFAIAIIAFLTTGCGDAALEPDAPVSRSSVDLSFLESKQIFEPQVTFLEDGTLIVIWREPGEEGSNIYVAVRNADGLFGAPVRVNDDINTVESYAHDGMRAAIAVGTGNTFAIAWADGRAQVRTATSADGGRSFQPSIRLDQSGKPAYRGYPAISFDSAGDLHAIWIDSRLAEGMAEEPADLFYAKVVNGIVAETNLTADQEPTICGCCRTFIDASKDTLTMTFRNMTAAGYRDPNTITGSPDGGFGEPQPVSDPLWELRGCPMAGPIQVGNEVLWQDGSTGKKLLMSGSVESQQSKRVFDDTERGTWKGRRPPRAVSTIVQGESVLLLPGEPESRLIARIGDNWKIVADDLPSWATSSAYDRGNLILVGAPGGNFKYQSMELSDDVQAHF